MRELGLKPNHRQHKGLNNQAELSHQWTRLREKKMLRFKLAVQAQKFLSAAEVIYQQSQPKSHQLLAEVAREIMKHRIQEWKSITGGNMPKQKIRANYWENAVLLIFGQVNLTIPNFSISYNS